MTDRELMQQALEALELHAEQYPHMQKGYTVDAITALRQALETEQEPVAWISEGGDVSRSKRYMDEMGFKCNPLYTAPPKQWVGLTDEEIQDLSYLSQKIDEGNEAWFDRCGFARAVEQALKEKNT